MRKIILFLALAIVAGCSGESEEQQPEALEMQGNDVPVAEIIENAVFTDLDGNEVRLEDYRGKVLLIDFWETWCGPCLVVFPSMDELKKEYPDHFDVLAVTIGITEGPEDARAFREENSYDFHYLYDENKVSEQLRIHSIPFKIYIDPEGKFIKQELGSRGREQDYENTKSVILEYTDAGTS